MPYTGIIMSTRENPAIRLRTLELGVSQISAGSRTNPGGYQESSQFEAAQFQLGDHRSLAEVIADLGQHKFIPSFCTGCYRLCRTGKDFMGLAKPGLIKDPYIYKPDSIMLDLEDAVAENQKDAARYSLYHALQESD